MEKILSLLGFAPKHKVVVRMELPGGRSWEGSAGEFITSNAAYQLKGELVHEAPETVETTATVDVLPIT